MIASCLERRENKVNDVLVHAKLADRVEARLLLEIACRCVREIEVFECERSLDDYSGPASADAADDPTLLGYTQVSVGTGREALEVH